jgi:hypothetical protein
LNKAEKKIAEDGASEGIRIQMDARKVKPLVRYQSPFVQRLRADADQAPR